MSNTPQPITGKAVLHVVTEIPDVSMLQDILNHVATAGEVSVEKDKITYEEADDGKIRPMLAEIGIEVSEPETVAAAEEPATEPAAAAPAAADPAAVTAAAGDLPAADTAAEQPEPSIVSASEDTVSEEQLYDGAESAINQAGEVSGVLSASASDRHWIVIAGGQPIARISLANQPKASALAGHFGEVGYWNTVVQAFQKNGVSATLRNLKAEVFTAKAVKASEGPDVQAIVAGALSKYRQCLSMAFSAASKNMIQNRLKAAAYDELEKAGVPDPEAVVEAVFASGEDFLEDLNAGAEEYMAMDDSGRATASSMLQRMSAQSAGSVTASLPRSRTASDMAARLVAGNMPITTAGAEGCDGLEPSDEELGKPEMVAGVNRNDLRASLTKY